MSNYGDHFYVLNKVRNNGVSLKYASDDLKNNFDIVMEAVKQNSWSLSYVSNELKNNFDIVMEAVKQNGVNLEYASDELKNNYDIVMKAVKQHGFALGYASKELKNNFNIVMEAVKQNGCSLGYASNELKNNYDMVLIAVKQFITTYNQDKLTLFFKYLGQEIHKDKLFINLLYSFDKYTVQYIDTLHHSDLYLFVFVYKYFSKCLLKYEIHSCINIDVLRVVSEYVVLN